MLLLTVILSPTPPTQSHDNMFLLQAILLPVTEKSTRSICYEAESHFVKVNNTWAARVPGTYRTNVHPLKHNGGPTVTLVLHIHHLTVVSLNL